MFKRIFGQGSGGGPGPGPKPSVTSTNRTVDAIQKLGEVRLSQLLRGLLLTTNVHLCPIELWQRELADAILGVHRGALQALLS